MGFPQVEKHLKTVGLLNDKNGGDIGQLAHLMVDLQQEIESKDKLLKEKDELIVDMRKSETAKNIELQELRKKIESNSNRNEETVSRFLIFFFLISLWDAHNFRRRINLPGIV